MTTQRPHEHRAIHGIPLGGTYALPVCWCEPTVAALRGPDLDWYTVTVHDEALWMSHAYADDDGQPPA